MSYRNLRFVEYGMTNAIHYKCEFACDNKPASLPVKANPNGVTQLTAHKLAHTRKRRPIRNRQHIFE